MMQAEIDAPAYAFRMRRLRQSQENAKKAIEHINRAENAKVTDHLSGLCEDAYLHSTFDIQQGLGTGYSFSTLPESGIKEILRQSWSGDHYSNRIADPLRLAMWIGSRSGQHSAEHLTR